jgi:hypothetical protein
VFLKEIKVNTSNESWSHYSLDDGTILKVKTVLISVFDDGNDQQGNPGFSLQSTNVFGAIPSTDLIGNDPLDKIEDLGFKEMDNPWNAYTLENGSILMIRPVLTQVSRPGTRDIRGIPLYGLQSQATVKITIC